MSFKHDFEWSKQKYVEKWNSIWKKNCTISFLSVDEDEVDKEDDNNYKKSAIWGIENTTLDLNVWYDVIVRHQMMNKLNTIIFPTIPVESDKIRHYLNNTFVCGLEMEESVFGNDILHEKSIQYALSLFAAEDNENVEDEDIEDEDIEDEDMDDEDIDDEDIDDEDIEDEDFEDEDFEDEDIDDEDIEDEDIEDEDIEDEDAENVEVEDKADGYSITINDEVVSDSCWDNTTIVDIANDTRYPITKYFKELPRKSIEIKQKGADGVSFLTENILKTLLMLSSVQWPMRSKYFLNNFPFDFIIIHPEQIDWVLEASLSIHVLFQKSSFKSISPFKNIIIVPSASSAPTVPEIALSTFSNQKFANKLWNLSKFILHLQKTVLSKTFGSSVENTLEVKEANIIEHNETYKRYTREFILSLKEECTQRPPNLPDIIVIPGQKVVLNRWHPSQGNGGNVDEEKIRKCRGYMNKLTEKTVDVLLPKILPLLQPSILNDIILLVFQKILWDKHFHFIYSRLCIEVQKRCKSFIGIFMKKCTDFLITPNEEEDDKQRQNKISILMFSAALINDGLIGYNDNRCSPETTVSSIIDFLLEKDYIELLCHYYKNVCHANIYKRNEILDILKQFSVDKGNS
jgi:hypothetical protein